MTARTDAGRMTLADIARLAGVSRSAASRALDRDSPVGGERAERVRAVAREHGYVPNSWAANLRRQRSGVVGVVVPRLTDTVMAMLYEALVRECAERGYQAVVLTTDDDPRQELAGGRALVGQRVDGLVVTTARADGADPLLVELREGGVPYVLALRTDGQSPAALCDDRLGGRLATQHLVDAGHRRIAFIGGADYASSTQGRFAGYRDAMADAGLEVRPELVHFTNFSMQAGTQVAERLLALADVPTAVFTANDSLAVGLVSAATRAGLRVPHDLSVVGFNDTPLAALLPTPLTSVAVSFADIAAHATALLLGDREARGGEGRQRDVADPDGDLDGVHGAGQPRVRLTEPRLVVRESVAPPPV